jgi:hypothetical protein
VSILYEVIGALVLIGLVVLGMMKIADYIKQKGKKR